MPFEMRPSAQRLLAANGTQIPVLGCTTLNAQIGSQFIDIDGLVSEHDSDVMLRIDWLQANGVTWDFARSEILLNDQRFKLTAKRQGNRWCRRVVLAEDTVVPAHAQVDVSTKLVYDSLDFVPRKQQEVWGIESTRVKDGLLVARTVVPDKVDDVPVRVLNTTSAPVVVSKGTLLSNLQPLVPVEEATPAPPADGRKADLIITDMLARDCLDAMSGSN